MPNCYGFLVSDFVLIKEDAAWQAIHLSETVLVVSITIT